MIPEFGHYALILALCLAVTQSILPLLGAAYNKNAWMKTSRYTSFGLLVFIGLAFFCLAYAFISNDFSVAYVAENSNSHLPAIYRFCAVWGAHEGSLLLWVFILSIWMIAVSLCSHHLPESVVARVLSVLGMISVGFLLFLLLTSDPFVRLLPNLPVDGRDLNPLLQDPGLVSHPPMLYMGYVGFSVVFAFAIAGLMGKHFDPAWAKWSRPWTLVAWAFLTLGIILGSWWAYRELGWGGWWFWDPVENASFMPWLAGTALIHSLIVVEKRNTFKAWTVLLAIITFSLSLLGTFLVRSGVLISVHAFANDPSRGVFMLRFLLLVIGGSLLLYAWRAHTVRGVSGFNFFSRETLLLSNNILLTVAMATVLLGTLYPLIIQALDLGKLSVGPPYFNTVFMPLMLPVLFLMAMAPFFYWQKTDLTKLVKQLRFTLLGAILLALVLPWAMTGEIKFSVVIALSLALWIILATLQSLVRSWRARNISFSQLAMVFAHIGLAVCLLGIVLSVSYSVERDVRMSPGDNIIAGPYRVSLVGVHDLQGPNYSGVEGNIKIYKGDREINLLKPQVRYYSVAKTSLAKTAIDVNLFRDIYIALAEPVGKNAWALRVYYKPFVRWIWFGGLLMVLGGLIGVCSGLRKFS